MLDTTLTALRPFRESGIENPPNRNVTQTLSEAAKLSGLVAAFGYVTSRAHINRLGLTSTLPLSIQEYLIQCWTIVSARAPEALAAGLVVCAMAYVIGHARLPRRLRGVIERPTVASLGVAATVVALVAAWAVAALWGETDVAAGDLSPSRLQPLRHVWLFWVLASAWLLCLYQRRQTRSERATIGLVSQIHQWWHLWSSIALAVGGIWLAQAFGYTSGADFYPIASAQSVEGGASYCGLLIEDSEHFLALWSAVDGRGRVTVFPRDKHRIAVGPLRNVLDVAQLATTSRAPQPDCTSEHLAQF